ncbi:hypothetical protein QBC34DRAFT_387176 [Podospora aff. communis PSN243]|uniref:Uncharacterized protein n=1 Tax=Podospora aff. communis PSN243 TaxID=3040156 RepID=A0AAV9G5D8_9PEZI|nr:hypothetical protein QBC34DRAFT_387176 [Podospora aff. communis PSN243]
MPIPTFTLSGDTISLLGTFPQAKHIVSPVLSQCSALYRPFVLGLQIPNLDSTLSDYILNFRARAFLVNYVGQECHKHIKFDSTFGLDDEGMVEGKVLAGEHHSHVVHFIWDKVSVPNMKAFVGKTIEMDPGNYDIGFTLKFEFLRKDGKVYGAPRHYTVKVILGSLRILAQGERYSLPERPANLVPRPLSAGDAEQHWMYLAQDKSRWVRYGANSTETANL